MILNNEDRNLCCYAYSNSHWLSHERGVQIEANDKNEQTTLHCVFFEDLTIVEYHIHKCDDFKAKAI